MASKSAGGTINILLLVSSLGWGLRYFGQPHILSRLWLSSPKKVRPARIIAMVWVILTLGAAVLIGVLGKVYVENGMVAQNYC